MTRMAFHSLMKTLAVGGAIVFFCALGMDMISSSSLPSRERGPTATLVRTASSFLSYLDRLLRGELGYVPRTVGRTRHVVSIETVVADTYVKSLGLLAAAVVVAAILGVTAGGLAAVLEGTPFSTLLLSATLFGVSMPTFFTALVLQVAEIMWYRRTGLRLVPVGGFGWDAHMVLPALVLGARPLAQISRMTYVSMTESAREEFVRTARAKGLPSGQIWTRHVLPNAAVAVLTSIGVSTRYALASLPVVEYFFGWPGLGAALLTAIRGRQANLVITLALALGITFAAVNHLMELGFFVLDPRFRQQTGRLQE